MPLVEFLNDALGQCGYTRITSIDEGSPNANWCKTFYDKLRQAALSSADWSFASARAQLAQLDSTPAFEFSYQYGLPSTFLVLREYNGAILTPSAVDPQWWYVLAGRYRIEGTVLLTNEAEVKIRFTQDLLDTEKWSPLFYQMLANWLASKLAMAIGRDGSKSATLLGQAINLGLPLAAAVDGQQATTVTPYMVNDLTWGR